MEHTPNELLRANVDAMVADVVDHGASYTITRDDQPVAVLISYGLYSRLRSYAGLDADTVAGSVG